MRSEPALDWRRLFVVALFFGILFVLPTIVPVQIQVIVENVGDVSTLLASVWSLLTGIATFVSLVIAVRDYRRENERESEPNTSGPDTSIHIEGVEGDLNVVLGEEGKTGGYEPSNGEDERNEIRDQEG